jgi:hypothetical protein
MAAALWARCSALPAPMTTIIYALRRHHPSARATCYPLRRSLARGRARPWPSAPRAPRAPRPAPPPPPPRRPALPPPPPTLPYLQQPTYIQADRQTDSLLLLPALPRAPGSLFLPRSRPFASFASFASSGSVSVSGPSLSPLLLSSHVPRALCALALFPTPNNQPTNQAQQPCADHGPSLRLIPHLDHPLLPAPRSTLSHTAAAPTPPTPTHPVCAPPTADPISRQFQMRRHPNLHSSLHLAIGFSTRRSLLPEIETSIYILYFRC